MGHQGIELVTQISGLCFDAMSNLAGARRKRIPAWIWVTWPAWATKRLEDDVMLLDGSGRRYEDLSVWLQLTISATVQLALASLTKTQGAKRGMKVMKIVPLWLPPCPGHCRPFLVQ